MKLQMQLQAKLKMSITPALRHAIQFLQLSHIELSCELRRYLEKNPVLEEITDETPEEELLPPFATAWQDSSFYGYATENTFDTLEMAPMSLQEVLYGQLYLEKLTTIDICIGIAIIDSIDENGYLQATVNDIAAQVGVEEDEVVAVLHRIQQFEPLGCGARTVPECLEIQARALSHPAAPLAIQIIRHHLVDLAKGRHVQIAQSLKVSIEAVAHAILCVQKLRPKPGTNVGAHRIEPLIPDAYVYKMHDKWVIGLNQRYLPRLQIDRHYSRLIKKHRQGPVDTFLKAQIQEARWLIRSVEHRQNTVQQVITEIMRHQHAFLENGETRIIPLTLKTIALACGLHESTISRVTNEKFVHTPHGIFALKHFFSASILSHQGNNSARSTKAMIREVIAQEDPKKPFSDIDIQRALQLRGIYVARRTVAKYREALRIPSSKERGTI